MMLWYKAWRESRSRFLLSALIISGMCVFLVLYQRDARAAFSDEPVSYIGYIWRLAYKGSLRELFVLLAVVLGVGGLLRERDHRTAGFTLALPVSRSRWILSRASVGLAEVAVLSFLPALLLPAISPLVHQSFPFSQALPFSLLWLVCGALFFTVGFLSSVVFGGEYLAPVFSLTGVLVYSVFVELPAVDRFVPNIHDIMSGAGMPYFREDISMLAGALPWPSLAGILLLALGFLLVASRITRSQDF